MSKLIPLLIVLVVSGCTSFRTTVLQRGSDHRMYPNVPCAKTKGLPVKLKVPSHVEVTVKESFFIQATKPKSTPIDSPALANAKAHAENTTRAYLSALDSAAVAAAKSAADPSNANLTAEAANAGTQATAAQARQAEAVAALAVVKADEPGAPTLPVDCQEIDVCLDGQQIRHFDVETRVIYTDKVFTVDFRRPAGGVLNLSTIDMDDEQYFRQIKAVYEEQTLKQINGAIGAVTSGITGKSATINGENVAGLATDIRTVAVTKFDISDPYWEQQLNAFVDQHVTSQYINCSYQN